jgi:chemotaxis protein methyltransferase CheR
MAATVDVEERAGEAVAATVTLGERDFAFLRDLNMREAGIHLNEQKRSLVEGRLAKRLRHHGMRSYREYVELLRERDADGKERLEFVNCITTNKTAFFREQHHFDFLRHEVIGADPSRALRIWSAACSTGEEPYSIAMTVREARASASILASDIDTQVLTTARAGLATAERVAPSTRRRFARTSVAAREQRGVVQGASRVAAVDRLSPREPVVGNWPGATPSTSSSRNVVIYFNRETQERLFRRFAERLAPGGYLILGHSENLNWLGDLYEPVGKTIYRRRGARAAAAPASPRVRHLAPPPRVVPTHEVVRIEAGGLHVSRTGAEVRTVLGSCVAACLYDPILKVGGMNHFMLPDGFHETRPARYGVHAMELLINEIMKAGGDRSRLRAKVFGGASVIAALKSSADVGTRNVEFIRRFLAAERIPIDAEQLGGVQPLEVRLHTDTAKVRVRALQQELMREVVREEARNTRRSLEVPAIVQDLDNILF